MRQFLLAGIPFLIVFMNSCQSTSFFFNESENETYTELQLKSNGTFIEYVYFSVQDSLLGDDFGNVIDGTFERVGDTLFLTYESFAESSGGKEVYVKNGDNLIKLAPITYSHHFLNMVFAKGKSSKLRELPNYDSINWKKGF